jgi:Subtilisin inhibitor-like
MNVLAAILVASASTSLHITIWPEGQGQPGKQVYTLRCAPAGGTLPSRTAACTKLMRLTKPFAPPARHTACTQIYGGPQEAFVTGRLRGKLVRAGFGREDGCQIARWNRMSFLFPGFGSSANGR